MKKNVITIVAAVVVLIAISALLLFVFTTPPSTVTAPTIDITGSWKVASYVNNGSVSLPEKEYMVFTDTEATAHRDGTVIATSSYTIDADTLKLPSISKQYKVIYKTDNYLRFYESNTTFIELIRYTDPDTVPPSFDTSMLYGTWNVDYRTTEAPMSETLVFTETTLKNYRNGSSTPTIETNYTLLNYDRLHVDKLGTEFKLIWFTEDIAYFVEYHTGLVWQLSRLS